jgi:hypothetical protein
MKTTVCSGLYNTVRFIAENLRLRVCQRTKSSAESSSEVIFTSDNEVTHMISPESEQVEMVSPVVTHQKADGEGAEGTWGDTGDTMTRVLLRKGDDLSKSFQPLRLTANLYEAVEVWMGDLQDGMCMAIRGKLTVDIMDWTRLDDVLEDVGGFMRQVQLLQHLVLEALSICYHARHFLFKATRSRLESARLPVGVAEEVPKTQLKQTTHDYDHFKTASPHRP